MEKRLLFVAREFREGFLGGDFSLIEERFGESAGKEFPEPAFELTSALNTRELCELVFELRFRKGREPVGDQAYGRVIGVGCDCPADIEDRRAGISKMREEE